MIGTVRVVAFCRGRLGDSVSESEAVCSRFLPVRVIVFLPLTERC